MNAELNVKPNPATDKPIKRQPRVVIIGAGMSGILSAIKVREAGCTDITVLEKADKVGGTWRENSYPGLSCDVPAHMYTYTFEGNPEYSKRFAMGPEIFDYFQRVSRKYGIEDMITFNTEIKESVYEDGCWTLTDQNGKTYKADIVLCATGVLHHPRWPDIEGLDTFEGPMWHTAQWDHSVDYADKRVGIIGTGASAVQIVPELGKTAKSLTVFQRTPSSIDVRDDWPTDPNWARRLKPGWQAKRREKTLAAVEMSPEKRAELDALTPEEKVRRQENSNINHMMRIHKRIDEIVEDRATADALKPWYMFMCKRPCFHNEYLPTFNLPNVTLVDTKGKGITKIGERGPIFDGVEHELDLLVYATGFEVQLTGIYNSIVGAGGQNLQDKYADGIRTLLGIHTAGFPNLFIMGGYQASFQFNLTDMLQTQGDHIAACIDHVRTHGYQTIDATEDAESWWVQEVINHRGKTSRSEDCTPGYYNFEGAENRRQDGNYNGGFRKYFQHQGEVRSDMTHYFHLGKAKDEAS